MIRNDFVSNSSSSSFIISSNNGLFDEIKKDDLVNALNELNKFEQAEIYDLSDKKDLEKYKKSDLFKLNDEWIAPHIGNTKILDAYADILDRIGAYGFKYHSKKISKKEFLDDSSMCEYYKLDGTINTKDGKTKHKKIPDCCRETFNFIYKACGIQTMAECAINGYSHFIVHYSDNCVWSMDHITDIGQTICEWERKNKETVKKAKESIWETEMYTGSRFYEVLLRYFSDKGLINLYSEEVLNFWKVPANHWWRTDKRYKDKEYFFKGKKPSMIEIIDELIIPICICHEG